MVTAMSKAFRTSRLSRRDYLRGGVLGFFGWLLSPVPAHAESARHARSIDDGRLMVLRNFPILKQPDPISCGPTCCSMLLQYYGIHANIEDVKQTAGTRLLKFGKDEIGFTWPSRVKKALYEHGLESEMKRRATLSDVVDLINRNRPPIMLVRSSARTWHYVVAIGRRGNTRFRVADPLGREYWLRAETLDQAWSFDGDLRGQRIEGAECQICSGKGRIALAKCLFCSGDGHLPDIRRKVVESNLIERVAARTLILPSYSATPS